MKPDIAPAVFKIHHGPQNVPGSIENMRAAAAIDPPLTRLRQLPDHEGRFVIVGGAPSAAGQIDKIREMAADPLTVVATLNAAHTWLIDHGVVPNIHVMFEIDADPVMVLRTPHPEVTYYICSHCNPGTFEMLKDCRRVLWHCWNDPIEYDAAVAELFPGEFMVGGGYVTFFRTLNIGMILGFRRFELFGVDSSFGPDGSSHLPGYPAHPREDKIKIWAHDKRNDTYIEFETLASLALQTYQFMTFCNDGRGKIRLRVHGDGLLSCVHRIDFPEEYQTEE